MAMKTASSELKDARAAAAEVVEALGSEVPKTILFFGSSAYDPDTLAKAIGDAFPLTTTLGCTTAGELVDDQMLTGSLVACALYGEEIGRAHV